MKHVLLIMWFLSVTVVLHAQKAASSPQLRHVVMFGWKPGTDTAHIHKVVNAFRDLPAKIDLIKRFEWGVNNSPEGLNQGLTHCFFLTFHSEADRDAYIVHPAHKAFVALLNPAPDKVTVLDYWAHQ